MHSAHLRGHGGGSVGRLVLVGRGNALYLLVVAGQAVDAGLDENQTELGVDVLAVAVKVLAHGDSALDQAVEVLGEGRSLAVVLQDAEDLAAGEVLDLSDTHGVTELEADHGGSETLLGEVQDGLNDGLGGLLQPRRRGALEGEGRGGDALAGTMHTTHAVRRLLSTPLPRKNKQRWGENKRKGWKFSSSRRL